MMKMRGILKTLSFSLLVVLVFSCTSTSRRGGGWSTEMQELAKVFTELIPYLSSEREFKKSQNREMIEGYARRLRASIARVKTVQEHPNLDPSLSIVAAQFDHEIRLASRSLDRGSSAEAYQRLKSISRYCISCHTLLESHSEPFLPDMHPRLDRLSFLQRGDFFLATRRFSDAVYEYERGLMDPSWARTHRKEWNEHMERLLAVAVRVRNSADLSRDVVNRYFESNSFPPELRQNSRHWLRHISEWKATERAKIKISPMELAEKLLAQADRESKKSGLRSVRVLALRASGLLHEEMATDSKMNALPKAYYLAGRAAVYLEDLTIGALPESFFERCIVLQPEGELAETCYKNLQALAKNPRLKQSLSPFVQMRLEALSVAIKK